MANAYLIISSFDYEGFEVIEAHLDEATAKAAVEAANAYADTAPEWPTNEDEPGVYEAYLLAEQVWRKGHPLKQDSGYLKQKFTVMAVPLATAPSAWRIRLTAPLKEWTPADWVYTDNEDMAKAAIERNDDPRSDPDIKREVQALAAIESAPNSAQREGGTD